MDVVRRILGSLTLDGTVVDVRVGLLWTIVVIQTPAGLRAGLASTLVGSNGDHGSPHVRNAGRLIGSGGRVLAGLAAAESPAERAIGFAALNALIEVGAQVGAERHAEEIIIERGKGRHVAVVGHFPFVPAVRDVAGKCDVLELNPGPGDLPASAAGSILPTADVVAITGMALVNGTFEQLAGLCRPDAYVLVLGPSTPLSPILFDYDVNVIAGTQLLDIDAALAAVSQGANFRQIPGRRLLTMVR